MMSVVLAVGCVMAACVVIYAMYIHSLNAQEWKMMLSMRCQPCRPRPPVDPPVTRGMKPTTLKPTTLVVDLGDFI